MVIDLDCPITKYCVSLMTGKLCQVGIQMHIGAWNNHRIPGILLLHLNEQATRLYYMYIYTCMYVDPLSGSHRGIPNILADQNNHAARIPAGQGTIPTAGEAEALFVAAGGHLSPTAQFGSDPLSDSPDLIQQRQIMLEQNLPTPEELFSFTVNGDYIPFARSLQFMIETTLQLQ